ncbi:baseplate J/gp47 family protein [Paenibacillus luteus]|uniref:baseplate J/gp47 family protein n=1 Tax=Paenibacillus luteus TaxID=2545753 RepID=UPI00114306A9|nr:baseplate J/gp47 family protein [Paenibacillus luteus]
MINHGSGMEPRNHSPIIDDRTQAQLIEEIKKIAPYYTSEWRFRPEEPDPGTALSLMFTHLLEGNIKRLNQVPYKSFLAFLNHFNVELAPARPAMAQVTFKLVEGTPEPVLVEKGIQLAADIAGETEPIRFETARTILLTTANLLEILAISPKRDRIVILSADGSSLSGNGQGYALFGDEGENLQEHTFYIQHNFLFLIEHPAFFEFTFFHAQHEGAAMETVKWLSDIEKVQWEYYSDGSWHAFDRVYGQGSVIRLIKLNHKRMDPFEYHDSLGYWIRCRAFTLAEQSSASELGKVQFERMLIKSEFAAATDDDGIIPDRLYFNDIQLNAENGCEPFGDFFAQYGLFYVSNKEAFSKRGAKLKLSFDAEFLQHRLYPDMPRAINWKPVMKREIVDKVDIPDVVTIASIQWEYWNGRSWAMLPIDPEARKMFDKPWDGIAKRELTFVCPEDIEEIVVNAEENYWIRGRIVQINNAYSPNAIYYAPAIHRLRIRFGYEQPLFSPQKLLTINNLDLKDRTNEINSGGMPFRPFLSLGGQAPAVWLGFDIPPQRGPINLYVVLKQRQVTASDVPFIEWEYLKSVGGTSIWAPLAVADDTNGFTRSGDIQFVGPQDFAHDIYFGKKRYWIRAVNRDGRYNLDSESMIMPRVLHLALNTTLAVQQHTIVHELPRKMEFYDTAQEQTSEYYVLASTPVLEEEVWVDETEHLTLNEIELLQETGIKLNIMEDSEQEILRVWVCYRRVEQFLRSGSSDRHYMIDHATGRLSFGNGKLGKALPRTGVDLVRVTYTSGGGKRGNVPAGAINTLQSSIAFIEGVTNLYAAAGGCDAGTMEEAIVRGPKRFTHRNRAVIAEDFEWLTREAHPNVAKVKCLPNLNVKLEKEIGTLSIVVLPKSGIGNGAHFQELKRQVEASLLEKTASNIAFFGNLQVMEPALLEIGIQATVWVRNMDDVVPVERELTRKLNQFLDTLTGNADGKGWNIGQIVHHSMFYALLKSVGPVVHIPQLSLDVYKVENGERVEWNPEKIVDLPHSVVVPGQHRLIVELHK